MLVKIKPKNMIKITNLKKSFGNAESKVEIFRNLDFKVLDGTMVSLIGPSGSGKSTFLNLISGIDRNFTGELKINNKDISKLSDDEMTEFRGKNISYIFQNFKLVENLTVGENIDLVVDLNKLERNFTNDEILKIVGLEAKKDMYAFNLSGGESQRVAIARAFVGKTKILLADEPTGSLDQKNKMKIMDLIVKLHNKTKNTVILITHDNEVAKLSYKVYKAGDGEIVEI